jgi:V/A-type H+-transporting ATPase subunit I
MIVKMKKLTLLCTRSSQERTLAALRDLGAVHLQHVQPPEGSDLDEARNLSSHIQRVLEVLPKHPHAAPSGKTAYETVQAVWNLIHRDQALTEQMEALDMEIRRYEPFGSFSPSTIRELAAKGIGVKLYKAPAKELLKIPEGVSMVELSRTRNTVCFALIGRDGVTADAEEVPLPAQSLADMRKQLETLRVESERMDAGFHSFSGDRTALVALAGEADDRIHYLEARSGMGSAEEIVYLCGFFPGEQESAVRKAAADNGWAALIRDIASEDNPPTLLRNPKWVEPIKAVFDMIGVTPGYHEVDISAAFLVFFSIFFAMLVGDAGYGVLFLILTLVGKFKFRKAPQQVFNLLLITSTCTIVWGVLTGTYFGASEIPAVLKSLRSGWLTGEGADAHLMLLCFVIGATHLTIAHAWNAIRICNTWQVLAQIGWIGSTWTMFFAARTMVLGEVFPPLMLNVLWSSIALILLFMNPVNKIKAEWFNYVILPLNIVSNFVDLVSYLRLFAVGAAGFAVANAFNQMAVEAGAGRFLGGLITAVIIFAAHTLNIMLSAMGVMVHGIRLNTLEFSGHIGVQWAGRKYNPFRKFLEKDV